jgi:hypothetical protein
MHEIIKSSLRLVIANPSLKDMLCVGSWNGMYLFISLNFIVGNNMLRLWVKDLLYDLLKSNHTTQNSCI